MAPTESTIIRFADRIEPELPVSITDTHRQLTLQLAEQYDTEYPDCRPDRETTLTACLSIALRQTNTYVPDQTLCDATEAAFSWDDEEFGHVWTRTLGRTRRKISTRLEIGVPPAHPLDYERRARNADPLSEPAVDAAIDIIESLDGTVYTGRKPAGVLAATLYLITKHHPNLEKPTLTTLASVFDVSKVTIRNTRDMLQDTDTVPTSDFPAQVAAP